MEQEIKAIEKYRKPLLILFIGFGIELLSAVFLYFLYVPQISFLYFLSLLSIPAIILELIGFYKLKKIDKNFFIPFVFIVCSLGTYVVEIITGVFAMTVPGVEWLNNLSRYFECAGALLRAVSVVFLVEETNRLINIKKFSRFGIATSYTYIACQIISSFLNVAITVTSLTGNALIIIDDINVSLTIISAVLVVIYLWLNYKFVRDFKETTVEENNNA